MAYFIKRNDDKVVNVMLVQSILIDETEVTWLMKNGSTFVEKYDTVSEAQERLIKIQSDLMSSGGRNF